MEWKFTETAWNELMNNGKAGDRTVTFEDVYPLYGAIDIRNSSLERNRAIQRDLQEHLRFIGRVMGQLQAHVPLGFLESLAYKNESMLQSIEDKIGTEDEVRV
ncbi:MAG: hypothetical protein ICV79_14090, partial [Flavisolibacter sp.]|nr:hypothetical protein [Flavisolibacter sp.]